MNNSFAISTRRWRRASAFIVAAGLTVATAGIAAADQIGVDGDDIKVGNNISYGTQETPGARACSTRGTAVPGTATITYQGGPGSHLTPGEALEVTVTNPTAGITVDIDSSDLTLPGTWTSGSSHQIDISTTVATSVPIGTHTIKLKATGVSSDKSTTNEASYTVTITGCTITSSNTAPSVAFTTAATTSDEGSAVNYSFTITDPDAGQTWSYVSGYPDCDGGTASAATIDNLTKTGSFSCTFPDGPASHTVAVKVSDSANVDSNEATVGASVDNVAPTAAAPAFTSTAIDCRNSVTLGGISFSDPGLLDADWSLTIDWGDGSTDTVLTASTQGAQANQSHTYDAPGTYAATITVTDKDGGVSTPTASSNSVVVAQTYAVDFLPPFDDSSPSGLIVNKMKNGRVVPVKATIYDECAESFVTDPATAVTIATSKTSGVGTGDPVEAYADAGQSASSTNLFRWSSDGFWIYNLDSKSLGLVVNNSYRVDIFVGATKATRDSWAVLQPVK